jgi:hypothetical protein
MTASASSTVSIQGHPLERGPRAFGELTRSDAAENPGVLRERLLGDGYLFLPGFFESEAVLAVRGVLVERIAAAGVLKPGCDPNDAVALPGAAIDFGRDGSQLVAGNEPLGRLLYRGAMIDLYEALLGGEIRHFDFTWLRIIPPGAGTWIHTDIVFMGRGTSNLYTSWVPYGDIPTEMGGLAILEGSHEHAAIREVYGRQDVDSYCENLGAQRPDDYEWPNANPILDEDPAALRRRLGGRWLTADYRAGDLLVFGMFTAHGALDNRTDRIRLSSDSRYQLASDPIDERWVGPNPPGHTRAGKRGVVC